jgi:NAD(P)-dependent dehydrogenase (short-subunit alcohol dehydrogenase family)
VLVNNAANFYGGYFDELTPAQIEHQLATGLIGPMNVTRAVLPVMRKQRSGHIMSISSGAGLSGFELNSASAAAAVGSRHPRRRARRVVRGLRGTRSCGPSAWPR